MSQFFPWPPSLWGTRYFLQQSILLADFSQGVTGLLCTHWQLYCSNQNKIGSEEESGLHNRSYKVKTNRSLLLAFCTLRAESSLTVTSSAYYKIVSNFPVWRPSPFYYIHSPQKDVLEDALHPLQVFKQLLNFILTLKLCRNWWQNAFGSKDLNTLQM